MATLAIAGLYNLETNVKIDGFPLLYFPVCYPFHGISQLHGGVGYNVALAMQRLGNTVNFATLIGDDDAGRNMRASLHAHGLTDEFVVNRLRATPQAVVMIAPDGSRQTHIDLKDIQENSYPPRRWAEVVRNADAVIACNTDFSRPLLEEAVNRGKLVATDVHVLSDFDDPYYHDYLANADIVFLSHERLPMSAEQALLELQQRYAPSLIVIGMGSAGAMIGERGQAPRWQAAQASRPVVNTIGAGDALFAAFIDQYLRLGDAWTALRRAQLYAGWKIGESSASAGMLDQWGLAALCGQS